MIVKKPHEPKALVSAGRFRHDFAEVTVPVKFLKRGELYRRVKSELRTNDVNPQRSDAVLAAAIEKLCQEWEQLDSRYTDLTKTTGKRGKVYGSHLAVPDKLDIISGDRSNIHALKHYRVNGEQADYFSKLLDIFQRLPRYADLADANCPNPFNTLPNQSGVEASSDALDLYEEGFMVAVDETVVTVSFHSSYNEFASAPTKHQELEILGRQSLGDLRDQLYCLSEICGVVENDSFFYIEGVFYVDDRAGNLNSPASGKMMAHIHKLHEWLCDTKPYIFDVTDDCNDVLQDDQSFATLVRGIQYNKAQPDIRSMASTKIEDLHLSVDHKYLLCHENHCEHIIYFTDIRGHNKSIDPKHWSAYPLAKDNAKAGTRKKCAICCLLPAKHIVFGDRLAPQSPYYCCEHCEFLLHYSADGDLIYGDFAIFPYVHDLCP